MVVRMLTLVVFLFPGILGCFGTTQHRQWRRLSEPIRIDTSQKITSPEIQYAEDLEPFDSIIFHGNYKTAVYEITAEKSSIERLEKLPLYWSVVDTSQIDFLGKSTFRNQPVSLIIYSFFDCHPIMPTTYFVVYENRRSTEKILVGLITIEPNSAESVQIPLVELWATLWRTGHKQSDRSGLREYDLYAFRCDRYVARCLLTL